MRRKPLQRGQHPVGAQGAVDADDIGPNALQNHAHGRNVAAQKGTAVFLISHGGQHWQPGVFLGCEHSRPGFGQIHHGFEHDGVRPGVFRGYAHLFVNVIAFLKGHGAGGPHQAATGSGRHSHAHAGATAGVSCTADGHRDDLLHRMTAAPQLQPVGTESIAVDELGAGLHILTVDAGDELGLLQAQKLGQMAQLQALLLQHGAHCAV